MSADPGPFDLNSYMDPFDSSGGGKVGGFDYNLLFQNSSQVGDGFSIFGTRVLDQTKCFSGQVGMGAVKGEIDVKEGGAGIDMRGGSMYNHTETLAKSGVDNVVGENWVGCSKIGVEGIISSENARASHGAMELAGRELDDDSGMGKERSDVNNPGDEFGSNLFFDLNSQQYAIWESLFADGMEEIESNKVLDEGKSDCFEKEVGANGMQDLMVNEQLPDSKFDSGGVNVVGPCAAVPETRGTDCGIKQESKYHVSDLVWGKVQSHPWWPGQILDPSAASEEAMKYYKKGSYLVGYFGVDTFGWNEESKIKPFFMHFSQMEKQISSKARSHAVSCALDEVARRVELGLSCSCLPSDVYDKMKGRDRRNTGATEESSRRDETDNLSSSATFAPSKVVDYLKLIAQNPKSRSNRLELAFTQAQLLAFNKWKGRYHLPVFEEFHGFLDSETYVAVDGERNDFREVGDGPIPSFTDAVLVPPNHKKPAPPEGSSSKCRVFSGIDDCEKEKEKPMPNLNNLSSQILLDGKVSVGKNKEDKKTEFSGRKRKQVKSSPGDSKVKRTKSLLSPNSQTSSQHKRYTRAEESMSGAHESFGTHSSGARVTNALNLITAGHQVLTSVSGICNTEEVPADYQSPENMLLELQLAAIKPVGGCGSVFQTLSAVREFRNSICLEKPYAHNHKKQASKNKEKRLSSLGTADHQLLTPSSYNHQREEVPADYCTPAEMLLKLQLAATAPRGGYGSMMPILSSFRIFRNSICLENADAHNDKRQGSKNEEKQLSSLVTADHQVLTSSSGICQREEVHTDYVSPDEMLLELQLAAKYPRGYGSMVPILSSVSEYRNSRYFEKADAHNHQNHAIKNEEKQLSSLVPAKTLVSKATEDSYWTDRVSQLFGPESPVKEKPSKAEPVSLICMNSSLDNERQKVAINLDVVPENQSHGTDSSLDIRREKDAMNLDVEPENISHGVDSCWDKRREEDAMNLDVFPKNQSRGMEEEIKENSPTALLLNFTNLESIPSIANLNQMFASYGPLNESETEISSKSKRAKVMFKRRADAEAAFSSTGKYGILGPSLNSFRLKYYSRPCKVLTNLEQKRKGTPARGNAV